MEENEFIQESVSDIEENASDIPENPVYDEQVQQIAHDIYTEIVNNANTDNSDNADNTDISNVSDGGQVLNEEPAQTDYSQQLSDIYTKLDDLYISVNQLSQSVSDLQTTSENQPDNIRSSFDDIAQFHYVTLSLIFGLLIAILFFKGLKK